MRREIGLAIVVTAALAAEATPVPASLSESPRPRIELKVSARKGVPPLSLKLIGTVLDHPSGAASQCRIRIDWFNDTGVGYPFRTKEEIPCDLGGDYRKVPERFEHSLLLQRAGRYSYTILILPENGVEILSKKQVVRVFRNAEEMRSTGGRS